MSYIEIKRTLEGKFELYIIGELVGVYTTATKAAHKAYKYAKGQNK